MIKDENQYQYSQEWVAKFKKTIAAMDNDKAAIEKDYLKYSHNRGAIQCHIDKLEAEIAEYETLVNCTKTQPITIQVESFRKVSNRNRQQ